MFEKKTIEILKEMKNMWLEEINLEIHEDKDYNSKR